MSAQDISTGSPLPPLASNVIWLSPRGWVTMAATVAVFLAVVPLAWEGVEPFEPGGDFRIPYSLSEDYWLYRRWCREVAADDRTLFVGDSVVWGHYVDSRQTLTHYLNELTGSEAYANLGVDGIHPAALAGLLEHYGGDIRNRKVVLFCNPLWMSSPTHDLQGEKELSFNHPRLVPQFSPRLDCYKEPLETRLSIVAQRHLPFLSWAHHLRVAYFVDQDLLAWTLEQPYENPAAAVTLEFPSPDEPPSPEPVAEPWTEQGIGMFNPPWVDPAESFQWRSFERSLELLQSRGNRVFVLVGPFNEHMLEPQSLAAYEQFKRRIDARLTELDVPHALPPPLPSELYADASHPLAEGYALLARRLIGDEAFTAFEAD